MKPEWRRHRNREYDARRRREKPWRRLYATPRWRALRDAQLEAEPLCLRCKAANRLTPATVAHHKKPHKGDEVLFFDPNNVTSSCADCHDTIEQGIEARGYERGCDVNGRPIDPDHPWNRKAGGSA
ncbi:MAG: HNH endonuclease [Rhizobiales bacterium]|nr:HNH endonuclease [Hyphomicrobiales bacterium]